MTVSVTVPYPAAWSDNLDLEKEVKEKVFYLSRAIDRVEFADDGLRLDLIGEVQDTEPLIADVEDLMTSIGRSFARVDHEVIDQHDGSPTFAVDPFPELTESRQVVATSPGVFVIQGDFEHLVSALDDRVLGYARAKGAMVQRVPTTIATADLIRCGYAKGFPQHLMFAGSLHHDLDSLRAIAVDPDRYLDEPDALDDLVGGHTQILSPTVCHHTFASLSGTAVSAEGHLITGVGSCHRHEGRNHGGLSRLQTFSMREIVFLGSADMVTGWQEGALADSKALLTDWDLTWRVVVASDPFFATGEERRKVFQTMLKLKYELQMLLPHSGEWLAVASFNNHQGSLVQPFDVEFAADAGEPLTSGCAAWGLERLAYAITAQLGPDPSGWPDDILTPPADGAMQ